MKFGSRGMTRLTGRRQMLIGADVRSVVRNFRFEIACLERCRRLYGFQTSLIVDLKVACGVFVTLTMLVFIKVDNESWRLMLIFEVMMSSRG